MKSFTEYMPSFRLEIHAYHGGTVYHAEIHDTDAMGESMLWESPGYDTLEEAYEAGKEEWRERAEVDREAAMAERTRRDDYVPPTQWQVGQNNAVRGH